MHDSSECDPVTPESGSLERPASYCDVILEIRGGIGCITLNRPQAMNAASGRLLSEWDHALRCCEASDDVRVIIVTGAGKAFCAGADLSSGAATWDLQHDMEFGSCPIVAAYNLKKPVIAALNGHALGLGLGLALQCDFRIAALEGTYGLPEVRHGVLGDSNMHWLLPRLVGMEKALRLHLLGDTMDGAKLVEMGLAIKAVPANDVLGEAWALAEHLAHKCSPLIVGLAKQLCWQSWDRTADEMKALETKVLHHTMGRPDAVEGGRAFAERRAPEWTSVVANDWPHESIWSAEPDVTGNTIGHNDGPQNENGLGSMEYTEIRLEIEGGIACIILNRPEKLNVLSGGMLAEWDHALRSCDESNEVRAIIVTGAGKAFCAGADLSGGAATWDVQHDMDFSSCPMIPAYKLKKPVIFALNGHALGVGFSMAMQGDFRIVALEGKYGLPQVQHGVLGDGNMHWLLPRLVGMEKALQLHLLGEKLDGAQLVAMGLAMKAVPSSEVLAEARALAERLVQKSSPLIVGLAKQLCWQSWDHTTQEMEVLETSLLHYTMGRADAVEGGQAFAERRAPQWTSAVPRDWPEDWKG